jgi:formate transporter
MRNHRPHEFRRSPEFVHDSFRVFGWFPIMAFVSSGFEHSVANMYFIPTGIMLGANVTWAQFVQWNLIPVTIGNIVGGFIFIDAVYFYSFKKELSSMSPT